MGRVGDSKEPPRIIHATDFSVEAQAAEDEAMRLARALGAELLLVHVAVEALPHGDTASGMKQLTKIYEAEARWAEDRLAERARHLATQGVTTGWRRRVGVPYEEILKAASEEHATYIVMGTHGRGRVGRLLLGSVADRVIRHARCPVLVVQPRTHHGQRQPKSPAASNRRHQEVHR